MTTTDIAPTLETALHTLEFGRGVFLKLLDSIPAKNLTTPAVPGGNHALWIAGHIAWTDDYFVVSLGGAPGLPEAWAGHFGMGSAPRDDPASYPPLAEVKRVLAERRGAFVAILKGMDDAKLASPSPPALAFTGPRHSMIPGSAAWHEGMHAGQLTVVRRALGLDPLFG